MVKWRAECVCVCLVVFVCTVCVFACKFNICKYSVDWWSVRIQGGFLELKDRTSSKSSSSENLSVTWSSPFYGVEAHMITLSCFSSKTSWYPFSLCCPLQEPSGNHTPPQLSPSLSQTAYPNAGSLDVQHLIMQADARRRRNDNYFDDVPRSKLERQMAQVSMVRGIMGNFVYNTKSSRGFMMASENRGFRLLCCCWEHELTC